MIVDLHVLRNGELLETFRLHPGLHLLGSGPAADFLLSKADSPAEACRVELDYEGLVHLRTRDEQLLRASSGLERPSLDLSNADWVEIHDLRLLLLVSAPPRDVTVNLPRSEVPTAPSTGVKVPLKDTLALKVRAPGCETRAIQIDGPQLTFGRGPGNGISFVHGEVSRRHARLFRKPDGVWIEDLDSSHGTFLNGNQLRGAAEWPVGGVVTLSRAANAPSLELCPWVDALAETGLDEALQPLVGSSEEMRMLQRQCLRHGESDDAILILGENGTGKELVAQALGKLHGGLVVPVHCGALPEQLIQLLLFGHKKGAFTGATQDQAGYFQTAGNGTVFLDEIGELPPAAQAKLLRVLETGEYTRVGAQQTQRFKGRVVAATNRDLLAMVKEKTFREDLFHRLNVIVIHTPPLRAHLEDIPALARKILLGRKGKSGGKILSEGALHKLLTYPWPGNVRELRHTLDSAAANFDGQEIPPEAIQFTEAEVREAAREAVSGFGEGPDHANIVERQMCLDALAQCGNNVSQAAKLVGKLENSFRRCLIRHGLLPAPRGGKT